MQKIVFDKILGYFDDFLIIVSSFIALLWSLDSESILIRILLLFYSSILTSYSENKWLSSIYNF